MKILTSIPKIDDLHIHLRQDAVMKKVTPFLKTGGVRRCYVMPNTIPPISSTAMALNYRNQLKEIDPSVDYLMTLYLSEKLTEEELRLAAKSGISGVKLYPKGVTTNSAHGIQSLKDFYPQFKVMQEVGLVLNIHGEVPSDNSTVCVLDAEEMFLEHFVELVKDFPRLKIVLEHVTTEKAVECVKSLPDNVAATITLHHLAIIIDDWASNPHHFCKPVAKYPKDRLALQQVVKEGNPKFFLGTDSAPHPKHKKESCCVSAGVYTGAYIGQYLVHILNSLNALDQLVPFACEFGAQFYGLLYDSSKKELNIIERPFVVPKEFEYIDDEGIQRSIVPFMAGQELKYDIEFIE